MCMYKQEFIIYIRRESVQRSICSVQTHCVMTQQPLTTKALIKLKSYATEGSVTKPSDRRNLKFEFKFPKFQVNFSKFQISA